MKPMINRPSSDRPTRNRFSAHLMTSHQSIGNRPMQESYAYHELMDSDEDCYVRKLTIEQAWVKLDLGFIKPEGVRMIILENRTGNDLKKNPTEEEKAAIAKTILQVSVSDDAVWKPDWTVSPSQFFCGSPANPEIIKIRSAGGPLKLHMCIVPK